MSCYDGVTKHKCRLWCHVSGTDAMGQDIDVFGCADELAIKLMHETAKEMRQASASVDKVANEVRKSSDEAAARDVHLINGLRATVPVLQLVSGMRERLLEDGT
jgi:cell division protein ZapA (FtsZ GTPase activity inhibitor)